MRPCVIAAAVCVIVAAAAVRADAEPEARVKFKRPSAGVPAVPKPHKMSGGGVLSRKKVPSRSNINVNSLNSHRRQGRRTTERRDL